MPPADRPPRGAVAPACTLSGNVDNNPRFQRGGRGSAPRGGAGVARAGRRIAARAAAATRRATARRRAACMERAEGGRRHDSDAGRQRPLSPPALVDRGPHPGRPRAMRRAALAAAAAVARAGRATGGVAPAAGGAAAVGALGRALATAAAGARLGGCDWGAGGASGRSVVAHAPHPPPPPPVLDGLPQVDPDKFDKLAAVVRKLAGGAGPIADGREGGERGSQSGRRRLALHLLTTPPPLS